MSISLLSNTELEHPMLRLVICNYRNNRTTKTYNPYMFSTTNPVQKRNSMEAKNQLFWMTLGDTVVSAPENATVKSFTATYEPYSIRVQAKAAQLQKAKRTTNHEQKLSVCIEERNSTDVAPRHACYYYQNIHRRRSCQSQRFHMRSLLFKKFKIHTLLKKLEDAHSCFTH